MKIKTTELQEEALDWAVAKCKDLQVWKSRGGWIVFESDDCPEFRNDSDDSNCQRFCPTYDWAQGGPIIERERISTQTTEDYWDADLTTESGAFIQSVGDTALVAAMRCYVASKLGDEVEVPDEIL